MNAGDLVIYQTTYTGPRLAQFLRYVSDRRAMIRLAGTERRVSVDSLRAIGGDA
jgi:hypothetical protein